MMKELLLHMWEPKATLDSLCRLAVPVLRMCRLSEGFLPKLRSGIIRRKINDYTAARKSLMERQKELGTLECPRHDRSSMWHARITTGIDQLFKTKFLDHPLLEEGFKVPSYYYPLTFHFVLANAICSPSQQQSWGSVGWW